MIFAAIVTLEQSRRGETLYFSTLPTLENIREALSRRPGKYPQEMISCWDRCDKTQSTERFHVLRRTTPNLAGESILLRIELVTIEVLETPGA